jgi:hypothetical protein
VLARGLANEPQDSHVCDRARLEHDENPKPVTVDLLWLVDVDLFSNTCERNGRDEGGSEGTG